MAADFSSDVPDSTDWLSTSLKGLAAVEAGLRCQVCKDFYKTPMLTSCSHTFCSLCIRHALAHDGRCPFCRAPDQELKLRNNWSMDEVVESFSKCRTETLALARSGPFPAATTSPKRKKKVEDVIEDEPQTKRQRQSARLREASSSSQKAVSVVLDSEQEDDEDEEADNGDDNYVPEDGLVPCPICQSRMKQWQVFKHLDTCTGEPPQPQTHVGSSTSSSNTFNIPHGRPSLLPNPLGQHQQRLQKPPDRLPAVNYPMLKDNAMRKKLSELGLPTSGPRHLLEKRHKEWTTLWNANCDSSRPKKRPELLRDLDAWERAQVPIHQDIGGGKNNAGVSLVKSSQFDKASWSTKHDSSFKDLVAEARKSQARARAAKTEEKDEGSDETRDGGEGSSAAAATVAVEGGDKAGSSGVISGVSNNDDDGSRETNLVANSTGSLPRAENTQSVGIVGPGQPEAHPSLAQNATL